MRSIKHKTCAFLLILVFVITSKAQTVSNSTELQTAISNATAGSEILLANGTWNNVFIEINKNGTAAQPIIIKAQNPGAVFMTGNSRVYMRGNYITVSGLVFQNPSNLIADDSTIEPIFELNQCDNCIVTNNKIDAYNGTDAQKTLKFKWIYIVDGKYNEISHNSFIGKYGVGSIINDNRSLANEDYLKIHHNYFADRVPVDNDINGLNDQDAIRIGTSTTSLSDSYSEVYDNFFYNWSGEVEIISNKSGKNKYHNNTFRDYQGTLTLRHGNGCEVFNNYFFANNNTFTGGVRIIGEDHKVYNNYIEGINSFKPTGSSSNVTGGINVMNGVTDPELNEYSQVKNAIIVNNTMVNCDYAIRIGTSLGGTEEPVNLTVANNIMYNTSINAYQINTNPTGTFLSEGNITNLTNTDILDDGSFHRLTSVSLAVDAAIGTYSFVTEDILGGVRDTNVDAGAEEYGANGDNLPFTTADVGVKIGFLSSQSPFLNSSLQDISYIISGGTINFDVSSNINWLITDNADWLTLNVNNGMNGATISATATTNNSGANRTATITISEDGGELSQTINVTQSDGSFGFNDAVELTGITVTGVGTQDGGVNLPENTLDGNDSTRWSANSTDGSAYLTYDLQCKKLVTEVKIYFHKGDSRTSEFKIATSTDGTNFTDVTNVISSSGNTVGFESFPFSPFQEVQFIRIFGYGNSEGSGWNSYEEVQIFGDDTCASLSVNDNLFNDNKITFYPNPTSQILNLEAINKIGLVEIFDLKGKKIISKRFNNNKAIIDVNFLSKGFYIIKTNNSFSKFIVN
ncbi:discoidin domain-containing protein [Polaribacter vadi]|uniref:chondroitinase-B domain-containing protein n=1 Tax=Polaribacter TaxID=52959 RepID=UPI001C0A0E4C|nr:MULTISPECIES: chondroitinase-B domain-containing protein [Polaribacter]MBU3011410.1 discoidin domain-containing protein [Polaribacter vadi]MDO6741222.1 chondroitinase-B domain-containing protein [Polaribacter sp. 1_MG-2023]